MAATVGIRERGALRADAAFEVLCGSVLMANPLVGPDLGVNGYLVGVIGLLLMVAAVFLGGAGLGKGPLAGKLRLVCGVNALCGLALLGWIGVGSLSSAATMLLALVAGGLLALAVFQATVLRRPQGSGVGRVAPTQAELHAAMRGERPTSTSSDHT
jgi:hypothetical protein